MTHPLTDFTHFVGDPAEAVDLLAYILVARPGVTVIAPGYPARRNPSSAWLKARVTGRFSQLTRL